MLRTTLVRTIQHLIPVLCPGFAPGHFTATGFTRLAGQVLFVALEAGFGWVGWSCDWVEVLGSFFGHERILSASNKLDNIHHRGYVNGIFKLLVKT
jgi:hypothetical protein